MNVVEFQAKIKNGMIEIPTAYRGRFKEQVRVMLFAEEGSPAENLIEQLLRNPIRLAGFKPLSREEIYEQR